MRIINRTIYRGFLSDKIPYFFCKNKYPYNINLEENANYLKKVVKAEKDLEIAQQRSLIPRRKRRIYDKPRIDLDITNFTAWRIYNPEEMLFKYWVHGSTIAAKIQLQPKWVIHAFGMGLLPVNHGKSVSLQFSFEDNNFSKYLLYEYRNTTKYEKNIPDYDYQNQENIPEKRRKRFRLSEEQFWKSQQYFEFRLNCSDYAEKFKFKKWIEQTVEKSKKKESYDEFINKKFGPMVNYNKKQDAKYFQPAKPAILCVTPQHFEPQKKGEKLKEPKIELPKRLGEEYRILQKRTEAKEGDKVQESNTL